MQRATESLQIDIDINKNSDASLDDGTVIKGDGQRSALYGGSTTAPLPTPAVSAPRDMPEIETMDVELVKDRQGLGITIAGYTG